MRSWQTVLASILAVCGLSGIMIGTNPDRSDYEAYAVEQLGNLARSQCDRAPAGFAVVLQEPCQAAVTALKPELKPILSKATTRHNLILFSLYRSNISIPAVNLHTKVESIGLFNSFYTYRAP